MTEERFRRRTFLRGAFALAGGSLALPMGAGVLGALAPAAARADFTDYKALVCVFLWGGNDSFNWLVPREVNDYAVYAEARGALKIPRSSLLPIQPASGLDLGLHPSCPGLQALFASRDAAFVANCGVLLEPTNRADYRANRALPPALFSHNDQADHWMSARPGAPKQSGWAGRMHAMLPDANGDSPVAMNLSLGGSNLWQSGGPMPAYVLGQDGPVMINDVHYDSSNYYPYMRAISLADASVNPIERAMARSMRNAFDVAEVVDLALQETAPPAATFDDSSELGQGLRTVAHMIAANALFGAKRQVFFLGMRGFDTHDNQSWAQPALFAELDAALTPFQQEMRSLGLADQVTLFTASEFGRTLTVNGDGTDHGWGAHHLVLGGAVRGGRIYGEMPDLRLDGPQDAGFGRIIPGVSSAQYLATLARWFGVAGESLPTLFPGLQKFSPRTLGFLR